jgi:group I intron endonuclease
MKNEYCVYMHTFPNGKRYIGQTKQKPEYRWSNGNGYKGCSYVFSAIKKYGWNNIQHEVLIDGICREEADKWEDSLIALYRTNEKAYGYNLRSGGTSGYEYTCEVKAKMSANRKGKKQSEETRKKHSEALKKYYSTHEVSEETRKKLSQANKGKKGRKLSPKNKEKAIKNICHHGFKIGHKPSEKAARILREKLSKSVIQYDLQGNKIAEYSSITEASVNNNLSINAVGNCVRGYTLTTKGYIWKYADEQFDISIIDKDKLAKSIKTVNQPRKIWQMSFDGNIINEFCSIAEAKKETGILHIDAVLYGTRKTAGGYVWRYADGN